MRLAPLTASAMPQASGRVGCSRSHAAASPQAKTGLSDTRTTELATVVNRSEAIQDQKWIASSRPDNNVNGSRERGAVPVDAPKGTAPRSLLPSKTASPPVTGRTSANRQNAIASAGAVANRTMGPAYVVASTATIKTRRGDIGAKPHPPSPAPQPVALAPHRPQIARSMRLRLALLVVTLFPALTGGAMLGAQQPSPYVPLGHWATPYLEHLIARGVIADPSPLSRPFVQADVVRALAAADTTRLGGAERRVVRGILATLGRPPADKPWARVDGDVAAAG